MANGSKSKGRREAHAHTGGACTLRPHTQVKELLFNSYGDVAAIVCSIFIVAYMMKPTSNLAAPFVVLQHNVTDGADGMLRDIAGRVLFCSVG